MRLKTAYICEKCGHCTPKWVGRCPDCDSWNSFIEEVVATGKDRERKGLAQKPFSLAEAPQAEARISTGLGELDRVLGGGIIEGSLILISGEPGIGKSTLTMKICEKAAEGKDKVLYVSGEESAQQIALRAKRMGIRSENISLISETGLENILATIEAISPGVVIVDSIQVVSSSALPSMAGSIGQVRFCTESLMKTAKSRNVPVIIIGHVTKDGNLAGPKILEHLVDTVVLIEGERYQNFRVVRCLKNRFGSTNEVGLFEMAEKGLKEIRNASGLFLEGRRENAFGSAVTATVEGTRPFLVEVQALCNATTFGYPRRTASGFDFNRLQLLIAVIQKHLGINMMNQDVFVNVAGGFKINDTAADLAVTMAIISSVKKEPLPNNTVYLGEIGLSGELRSVRHLQRRLQEAARIGFKTAFVPESKEKTDAKDIEILRFAGLEQLMLNRKS